VETRVVVDTRVGRACHRHRSARVVETCRQVKCQPGTAPQATEIKPLAPSPTDGFGRCFHASVHGPAISSLRGQGERRPKQGLQTRTSFGGIQAHSFVCTFRPVFGWSPQGRPWSTRRIHVPMVTVAAGPTPYLRPANAACKRKMHTDGDVAYL
jgi:hypothetical protein